MSLAVIVGATGTQGGSVARVLAKDPSWKVRGLTRNAASAKAKALEAIGVEIVAADLNDVGTLQAAFKGATAIFAVSDFWTAVFQGGIDTAQTVELQHLINIADSAAQIPTLKHLVLSVLPSCDKLSGGKLPCPHWDAKARGADYVKTSLPQLSAKTTFVWTGFYLDNFANLPSMQPQPFLGNYILAQASKPDAIVPCGGIVATNTGIVVQAILSQPEKTYGKYVPIITDLISWTRIAEEWSKAAGKTAVYAELTDSEATKAYGPLFGPEIASQLRFSEQYPDWNKFYPEETVTLKELGVKDKVVGVAQGLELLKDQIIPRP
ncbi:hypothetical protein BDV36DRAFT_121625 [Aspergillus pseudocaelatus]|uniref:NmrA-like domain-containing protein n=1 Tax=Aspergillus pseudocaelatus TaxID=1825620 RepID=A0ABQ6WS89_9EURO|nr:hypothetical protein BDV36DRAFT_121625 [Aspergillus pseudocaelatus]